MFDDQEPVEGPHERGEKWAAQGASFVAKTKATKEVWFPPQPVKTTEKTAARAKKTTAKATKKTAGATKKTTGAAKKTTKSTKKVTNPVGRKKT